MIWAALASLAIVGVYVWQDGQQDCNDGSRYTSGSRQPYPFHRRFCSWPKLLLQGVSLASLVALGALMGSWKGATLFLTLPGAWLIATHPTTVDAPAMLLAMLSALASLHGMFVVSIALSCAGGVLHERSPVFAALYAWQPWPLVGLLVPAIVGRMKGAAPPDADPLVGRGFVASLDLHRPFNDWLNWEVNVFATRGLLPIAAFLGAPASAWLTLAFAWATRLMGTDPGRFVFWGAPMLVRELGDVPTWMLAAHVATFRRVV